MTKSVTLNGNPTQLKLVLKTPYKEKLWIKVADAERPNTLYTMRYAFVEGQKEFVVLMPQAPKIAQISIVNESNGNIRNDTSFSIVEITAIPYKIPNNQFSKKTQAFVKFAQEFSDECGYLSASKSGDIYTSNNKKYRIDYFDEIRNSNGVVVHTPARISQLNGRIEISAKQFREFTIPMRMAILLHEYSHYYLNKNPSNEVEADLNGLTCYLKMGYPKIDIYNVFLNVFKKAPSMVNKERFDKLNSFVKNYK
jgi:hypothetical protein